MDAKNSSAMNPTIYVITHYASNHERRKMPIDPRFFDSRGNYVFYLIDKECPYSLQKQRVLFEQTIDNDLYVAGGKYFAEWSFLLAEAKHGFCDYPLFMVSSRFYEKNQWLLSDLNDEWNKLFQYLEEYGWGYLPSYNRPLRWIDLERSKKRKAAYGDRIFFPLLQPSFDLIRNVYGAKAPKFVSDLFCNYIGFHSRQHLLEYIKYYRPMLDFYFDTSYRPKVDLGNYVEKTGMFHNEKEFTLLLEVFSHLFFFNKQHPFFALSYDGYYEVKEHAKKMKRLESFSMPLKTRLRRKLGWQRRKLKTEVLFWKYPTQALKALVRS